MMQKNFRKAHRASALMEYVLPMFLLLVAVGVLTTIFNINSIMGDYFLAASGNEKGALQGGTFKPGALGSTASGAFSNGAAGFGGGGISGGMVTLSNGDGVAISNAMDGIDLGDPRMSSSSAFAYGEAKGPYNGPLFRSGGRVNVAALTANERLFLFDDERGGSMRPAPTPITTGMTTTPDGTTPDGTITISPVP